jgi:1,4-dihydroxy-2-naphthoate octaprenyltransferase
MNKSKLHAWISIQELPKHLAVIFRVALGSVLAWYATNEFSWPICLLMLLALFLLADGAFVSNEYFDYQTDLINTKHIGGEDQDVTSTGGTRVLTRGLLSRKEALWFSIICYILAIPIGLVLQFHFHTGPWTIPLGVLGMFAGWFYTAPPVRAAYRGMGETFMAIAYFFVIFTTYYVQAGFSWLPIMVSLTQLFASPAAKIIRTFPDLEADAKAGKRTLAVKFGKEAMSKVFAVLVILAILGFIPTFIITKSPVALLSLLPIFLFIQSLVPIFNGSWRTREGMIKCAKNNFRGNVISPMILTIIFLIAGIID